MTARLSSRGDHDPGGPWQGFPSVLFRVPALAVTRVRGRTFASGDLDLLEQPAAWRAPAARRFDVRPVPGSLTTPYDRTAADHTRYVSFADWLCPTHCVEPAICPAIGRERTTLRIEQHDFGRHGDPPTRPTRAPAPFPKPGPQGDHLSQEEHE